MEYLKEDGSLDIERINGLPFEEFVKVADSLTKKQMEEYSSSAAVNESDEPIKKSVVDVRKLLADGCVFAEDVFK